MNQKGKICLKALSMEYFEKEEHKLSPIAVNDYKIVPVISINRRDGIIRARQSDGQIIELNLNNRHILAKSDISYLIAEYKNYIPGKVVPMEKEIDTLAWQFILDSHLINSKIEFDDTENIISRFSYYKKPEDPGLKKVFKIKGIVFEKFLPYSHKDSDYTYMKEDYTTYEEAEKALVELAKKTHMDIDNERQCYFKIEEVLKRTEYQKEIFRGIQ